MRNNTAAMTNDGITVHIIARMWLATDAPVMLGTSTVVSDSGVILSPTYAPEITAPAVIAWSMPSTLAMPTKATPSVPDVVQELPVTNPVMAQMSATAK